MQVSLTIGPSSERVAIDSHRSFDIDPHDAVAQSPGMGASTAAGDVQGQTMSENDLRRAFG